MFNGSLRVGSAGAILRTHSSSSCWSGEFEGMRAEVPRSHSTGTGSGGGARRTRNSGSRLRGGGSGGRGSRSSARPVRGEGGAQAGPSSLGLAGMGNGDDEGCGGEEEEEEEEVMAWHSLEATPLIDTATGKKVRVCSLLVIGMRLPWATKVQKVRR